MQAKSSSTEVLERSRTRLLLIAAVVIAGIVMTFLLRGGDDRRLLVRPGNSFGLGPAATEDFFLIKPGEQPSPENQVDLPKNLFSPRFTDDGRYLIGHGSVDSSYVVVMLDVSTAGLTEIHRAENALGLRVAGSSIVVCEHSEQSSEQTCFFPLA